MNENINLLKETERKPSATPQVIFWIRIVAVVCIVSVGLVSVVLLFLKSTSALGRLQLEETQVFGELATFSEKRTKLIILENRLSHISDILKHRPKFEEKIDVALTHIPSDIEVTSLQIDNQQITLALKTSSLASINQLFNNLVDTTLTKNIYNRVAYEGLTIDLENSAYSLSIRISFI